MDPASNIAEQNILLTASRASFRAVKQTARNQGGEQGGRLTFAGMEETYLPRQGQATWAPPH